MSIVIKTFLDAYNEYKEYAKNRHKKQGFQTHIRNIENHILPYFKNVKNISLLQPKDIVAWQNIIIEKNFTNSFNNSLFYAFSSFLEFCKLYNYIEKNVVLEVKNFKKKIEYKEHHVYRLFEFIWFRIHLEKYTYKQFFNFMYFYGTRPSEAMALRFCDIEGFSVHIRNSIQRRGKRELDTPKNQSSVRTLNISILMKIRILRLKHRYEKEYGSFNSEFFVFGGKKPLSTSTIDRHKKMACKKAHIFEITQHEFRHSYATRMIHKHVPIDKVSRSMGHSKVSMTCDKYLHEEKRMSRIHFPRLFF